MPLLVESVRVYGYARVRAILDRLEGWSILYDARKERGAGGEWTSWWVIEVDLPFADKLHQAVKESAK